MSKRSIFGVVVGSVTDMASTAALDAALIFTFAFPPELAPELYQRTIEQALREAPGLLVALFIVGGLSSIFGGYLAARIAGRNEVLNGALSSFLCVGSGLYTLAAGNDSMFPLWSQLVSLLLSPALGSLGGYVCLKLKKDGQNI